MEERIVDIALKKSKRKKYIAYTYQDKQNKTSTKNYLVHYDGNDYIEKKIIRDGTTQTQKFYIVENPPTSTNQDYSYHIFRCKIDFTDRTFSQEANFHCAEFSKEAKFRGAEFSGKADFRKAQFSQEVDFREATFSQEANFEKAQFSQEAYFGGTKFSKDADFRNAEFSKDADFKGAGFSQEAYFKEVQFSEAKFKKARFFGKARFIDTKFSGEADFSNADFEDKANFDKSEFFGNTYFAYIEFQENVYFTDCTVSEGKEIDFSYTAFEKRLNISFPNKEPKKLEEGKIKLNLLGATIGFLNYAGREFKADNRETFTLLKATAIKQSDQITALKFHKQEMETYYKELYQKKEDSSSNDSLITDKTISVEKPSQKKEGSSSSDSLITDKTISVEKPSQKKEGSSSSDSLKIDKIILYLEKKISHFGTNPLPAFVCFILWNCFFFFIYYWGFDIKNSATSIFPGNFLKNTPVTCSWSLSILNFFQFDIKNSKVICSWFLSILHLLQILGNVFLSYEFVKSLRKFSRKF